LIRPAKSYKIRHNKTDFERLLSEITPMQRTLVLLKPDAVQRRVTGQILHRFEQKGLNMVALKLMRITPELAKKHYAEHVQKGWYPSLEGFITSGPVMAMILEGPEAVRIVRDMVGATNGQNAVPGTIRGDYGTSRQMNLVHASDSPESALRETGIFFGKEEICECEPALRPWLRASDE